MTYELRPPRGFEWLKIKRLYKKAFPRYERKPFSIIKNMYLKGKTDVWYFEKDGLFSGFAATLNGEDTIMLDYFAVPQRLRKQGTGSAILKSLLEHYSPKAFFVEIESAFEKAENKAERLARRNFYIRNGLLPLGVMANVFDVKMELLGARCDLDFASYHAFYRDNYSPWAASHIFEAEYPKTEERDR
ncbi:MAG: hypothetical protein IKM51_00060 [Oscillospiraceae bacterium]|nr:hypothetical protein [Oscillospiraceae bacterium]